MRFVRWRATASVALISAPLLACEEPTAFRIDVYSEVDCAKKPAVGIALASDLASLATAPITSVSSTCTSSNGYAGTLVVAPTGSRDEDFVLRVVTQVDGESPSSCTSERTGEDCIFARRSLRFSPHEDTDVRIDLRLACVDIECAPTDTCVRGACRPISTPITTCDGACDETMITGPVDLPLNEDAGAVDATVPAIADASTGGHLDSSVPPTLDAAATIDPNTPIAFVAEVESPFSARYGQSFAYDVGRAMTVVAGGTDGTSVFGDIYEFDGVSWEERSPKLTTQFGAATYDPVSAQVFFFGGAIDAAGSSLVSGLMTWNGSSLAASSSAIAGRFAATLTPRPASTLGVLVAGGRSESLGAPPPFLEIWDGTTWTARADTARTPPSRYDQGAAYDEGRGVVVVYGGIATSDGGGSFLGDVYEFDGSKWTNVTPSTGVTPGARFGARLVYDVARARIVLYGGASSTLGAPLDDFWTWDGSRWTQLASTVPDTYVKAVHGAVTYDRARSRYVIAGGRAATGATAVTYVLK